MMESASGGVTGSPGLRSAAGSDAGSSTPGGNGSLSSAAAAAAAVFQQQFSDAASRMYSRSPPPGPFGTISSSQSTGPPSEQGSPPSSAATAQGLAAAVAAMSSSTPHSSALSSFSANPQSIAHALLNPHLSDELRMAAAAAAAAAAQATRGKKTHRTEPVPQSGFKGVSWNSRMKAWLAFYVTENGERKSKTFSTRKLGMEEARMQAIAFCRQKQDQRREARRRNREMQSQHAAAAGAAAMVAGLQQQSARAMGSGDKLSSDESMMESGGISRMHPPHQHLHVTSDGPQGPDALGRFAVSPGGDGSMSLMSAVAAAAAAAAAAQHGSPSSSGSPTPSNQQQSASPSTDTGGSPASTSSVSHSAPVLPTPLQSRAATVMSLLGEGHQNSTDEPSLSAKSSPPQSCHVSGPAPASSDIAYVPIVPIAMDMIEKSGLLQPLELNTLPPCQHCNKQPYPFLVIVSEGQEQSYAGSTIMNSVSGQQPAPLTTSSTSSTGSSTMELLNSESDLSRQLQRARQTSDQSSLCPDSSMLTPVALGGIIPSLGMNTRDGRQRICGMAGGAEDDGEGGAAREAGNTKLEDDLIEKVEVDDGAQNFDELFRHFGGPQPSAQSQQQGTLHQMNYSRGDGG